MLYSNESRGNKKSIIEWKKQNQSFLKARGYAFIIVDVGKSERKVKLKYLATRNPKSWRNLPMKINSNQGNIEHASINVKIDNSFWAFWMKMEDLSWIGKVSLGEQVLL